MNVLPLLENGLFALGQVLRLPVMLTLWICVCASLYMSGQALMEFAARRRERRAFNLKRWLLDGSVLHATSERIARLPAGLRRLRADVEQAQRDRALDAGGFEHLLLEREDQLRHSLTSARMLVKIGPSVGLLGTLIPMGTSLASLATGNLDAMAGQMVVAFTTTIVGLATGTIAYVVAAARQGWVTESIREQRFLMEHLAVEMADASPTETGARRVG